MHAVMINSSQPSRFIVESLTFGFPRILEALVLDWLLQRVQRRWHDCFGFPRVLEALALGWLIQPVQRQGHDLLWIS